MSDCVPDLDVGSSELSYLGSPHLSTGEREAVAATSVPLSGEGKENYSSHKRNAGACVPDHQASWTKTAVEEKQAHAFVVGEASASAIDVPLGHSPFQEDEMLSWLQYPLDDTFNKSYCSEQLCEEQPFGLYSPSQSSIPRSVSLNSGKLSSTNILSQLHAPSASSIGIQMLTSDAAMAMGAQRAAGLLPQAEAEAFNRIHTSRQFCHDVSPSKARNVYSVEDNHADKQSAMNFSFLSQRVAAVKTSLQILGTSGGSSIKERLKQPFITQVSEKSSSVEQSSGTASLTSLSPCGESYSGKQGKEMAQGNNSNVQKKLLHPMHHSSKAGKAKVEINSSAGFGSEILETGDVTVTSLSDGSDYSTEKSAKEMGDLSCKRKSCPAEEFECDSKDARWAASRENNPTLNRPNSVRRTRAAEIHNQSERRRRNKINEKMKALQELIPNANKTDKASMLDEAIEYVKMLQGQLQLMSMRTGMIVPPVMMPPGMQYLSVQRSQGPPQMYMGMGVSRGAMDASNGGVGGLPRPAFLGQTLPGHAYHLTGYQPNGSPSEVPSSMNLSNRHTVSAFQQFQPSQSSSIAIMNDAHTHLYSDLQKHH